MHETVKSLIHQLHYFSIFWAPNGMFLPYVHTYSYICMYVLCSVIGLGPYVLGSFRWHLRTKEAFGADLALVWCLKPQLSTAAVAAGAVETVGTVVVVVTPTCSFQDGFAVAEEAEAATAAAAAPESGCCSAAAIWGRKCEDNEGAAIKTSNTENQKERHKDAGKHAHKQINKPKCRIKQK